MGADRTLMQVKVRCGLGRVGVLDGSTGTAVGCPLRVQRRHGGPEMRLPVCPHKRTQLGHRAMSETCPFKRIMLIGIVEDRPAVEPSAGAW